jgi:hypothetical protein
VAIILKKLGCSIATLSLLLVVLSGCSNGNASSGEAAGSHASGTATTDAQSQDGASTASAGDSSYPMDGKEFAHRYNKLADPAYQIVSISPNRGFNTLDLASSRWHYITAKKSGQYSLNVPRSNAEKLPDSTVARICEWMIQAAGPSISPADAADIASKVTSNPSPIHRVEIIKGGVVVDGSRDYPCDLMPTGL